MLTAREAERERLLLCQWSLQEYIFQGGAGPRLQRIEEKIGGKEVQEAGVEW